MKGYLHSFESFGTKDGPGIRFVVFMQGCPLRCLYCHNPDTWNMSDNRIEMTTDEVFAEIKKVKNFIRTGGVTLSGGEPLLQPGFALKLFKICKEHNIHTAIDTSGIFLNDRVKEVLEYTDLVLLDIKHINSDKYKELTGASLEPTLKFAEYLATINKPFWLRYVLVPGFTDDKNDLKNLAKYVSRFRNLEKVDILPFHQMATHKWKELGLNYKLENIQPPLIEDIKKGEDIFRENGLMI
ncbi:pyruvate formate lyase activating enzyme [Dysgonomonas hofstadii]|uniref:Pyruvate formate-lyase-activating enzyme n=1 Tax=Dysgonomonas hofstadii TaxID=637886 RepID=A0A840CRR9_9BACT|nr:pyruvate formate-lyase-activating protein [Dysgonomonas hofstadii]MBB4035625.1 pyruvate formate lyase activating enzyme [Dysgonomonas hofstadii]